MYTVNIYICLLVAHFTNAFSISFFKIIYKLSSLNDLFIVIITYSVENTSLKYIKNNLKKNIYLLFIQLLLRVIVHTQKKNMHLFVIRYLYVRIIENWLTTVYLLIKLCNINAKLLIHSYCI